MMPSSASSPQAITPSLSLPVGPQVIELIKRAYASGTPLLLEGPHGVGKSELVTQAASELGIDVIVRDLTVLETTDLAGYPYRDPDTDVMRFAPPAFLPRPDTQPKGLLLLEELNRCSLSTQHAAMQILTTRQIHDYQLPPGWLPMSTCNPRQPGRYQTSAMDAALLARFIRVNVTADAETWLAWARTNGIHSAVREYVALLSDPFADELSNPRSWTYVSNLLNASPDLACLGEMEAGAVAAAVAGLVGYQHASSLMAALRGAETPLKPADILSGPQGWLATVRRWRSEGRMDLLHSSLQQLLRHLRPQKRAEAVFEDPAGLHNLQLFVHELPGDLKEVVAAFVEKTGYTVLVSEPDTPNGRPHRRHGPSTRHQRLSRSAMHRRRQGVQP